MGSATCFSRRKNYPPWIAGELTDVSRISKELMRKRMPSMYGEETLGKPPRSLFNRGDAELSIRNAEYVFNLVKRLLDEWSGGKARKTYNR
jgi:HEPN domain-containing protein